VADVMTGTMKGKSVETTELDALVIGASFAGLYQLLCLRDRLDWHRFDQHPGGARDRRVGSASDRVPAHCEHYSVPARNAPLKPDFRQYMKQNPGEIRAITRETINGMAFRIEQRRAVETLPNKRRHAANCSRVQVTRSDQSARISRLMKPGERIRNGLPPVHARCESPRAP
jgi:hypothetical protein